jgi:site-specific DNA-methyltransferase (adenine-specific)
MKESRDILSLFEALNSHEVFTPPRVARQMLDLLPPEIWSDPSIKILDPCTKSGVFLRESFYRLFTSLDGKGLYETENGDIYDLDDKQQRINHILKNMLFGIATSELTSYVARRTLYGVMRANSDKQLSAIEAFEQSSNFHQWTEQERYNFIGRNKFNEYFDHNLFCTPEYEGFEQEGNIFYPNDEVKTLVMEEDDYEIEDKYFPFIEENTKHKKILDIRGGEMKFDVIIGNPPYQVDTGGSGRQAKPIYQDFVSKCKNLSPKYLIMIIPARWYAGGFGLDEFRKDMLSDRRVKTLVDYENASVVFPGVDIAGGVCYFLWDSKYDGPCNIINSRHTDRPEERRYLDEFDIFVRDSRAISILRKVVESNKAKENGFLNELVTGIRPFGLPTNYKPKDKGVPCWFIQKYGLRYADFNDFTDKLGIIRKWKVLVPKAPIAGQTDFTKPIKIYHEKNVMIAKPGEICTESYIVAGAFDNEVEANNYRKYLFSKIVRFLILMTTISQDINKKNYRFVPDLGSYYDTITDRDMRSMWDISDEEWDYIDSRIKCIYE